MALPRLQVLVAKVGFPDLLPSAAPLVTWGSVGPYIESVLIRSPSGRFRFSMAHSPNIPLKGPSHHSLGGATGAVASDGFGAGRSESCAVAMHLGESFVDHSLPKFYPPRIRKSPVSGLCYDFR